ncbi:hypothetical protein JFU04_19810 [Pseudomonas sp. TH21]|nr:hypothetical protein [Pseudomonas sp. TH21]MBK5478330.1 hypothetical protein [Pseudomonas sp. TH21]
MSCCSINNIARVVDVRQALNRELPDATNETTGPGEPKQSGFGPRPVSTPVSVPQNNVAIGDNLAPIAGLITLFNSLITRLIDLISARPDKSTPAITPRPEVTPPLVPAPIPAPIPAPLPAPTPAPQPMPTVPTQIPNLSDKRNGTKPDNIWSGFRQGPDGNCVTVSAIKAAMYRFGQSPTDIYKEVLKTNDGYRVTMRDDVVVRLTDQELQIGAAGSLFKGTDKGMLKDAQFLFAVSAKRAQMENNDGTAARSFRAAVKSLNDGEDDNGPGEGFLRLGLRHHMKRVSVRDLAKGQLGMCNRARHSVAVINGREEIYGRQGSAPTRGDAVALI